MSTVAKIIEAVKRLNVEEKREFLSRLVEGDFDDAWDRRAGRAFRSPLATGPERNQGRKRQASQMTSSTTPSFWRAYQPLPDRIKTDARKSSQPQFF